MAEKSSIQEVLTQALDNDDFSSANFRREFRADIDENGKIVAVRNGKHVLPKRDGRPSKLVDLEGAKYISIDDEEQAAIDVLNDSDIELDMSEDEDSDSSVGNPITIPNHPGRVMRVRRRKEVYNWSDVRKHFVLGKRIQLADGSFVSEDYTLKELALKFGISYNYLRYKSSCEKWSKLRKAYLIRVNQINVGQELGLYTQENYQGEIAAMNACNKLGVVLDRYIEYKFGEILESAEDLDTDGKSMSEELETQMMAVNRNTGTPIFITELKETVKVANDIYNLQRKVYENAPKTEMEIIERITNKPKFKTEKERQAKIKQLQAKLSGVLMPNEVVETVSVDSEVM